MSNTKINHLLSPRKVNASLHAKLTFTLLLANTMSLTWGQSMNYLPSQLTLPKSPESLGNSTFHSSRRNSYFNEAKYPETGCGRTGSENAYGELETVGEECKATCVPRKKANDLYESAQPMSHRKRHITECSDVSTASTISTEIVQVKSGSCVNKVILCRLILACVLVVVLWYIYEKLGMSIIS